MHNFLPTSFLKPVLVAGAFLLCACSPKYDWREVHGSKEPFVALLPAKPATYARPIDLGGIQVVMTMTAAEVNDVTFAVGTAELPDAAQARQALGIMKTVMVRNIGGSVKKEKMSPPEAIPATIDLEANSTSRLLLARFVAKDKRVYQLIVLGKEASVPREEADTFFTSFKPQ